MTSDPARHQKAAIGAFLMIAEARLALIHDGAMDPAHRRMRLRDRIRLRTDVFGLRTYALSATHQGTDQAGHQTILRALDTSGTTHVAALLEGRIDAIGAANRALSDIAATMTDRTPVSRHADASALVHAPARSVADPVDPTALVALLSTAIRLEDDEHLCLTMPTATTRSRLRVMRCRQLASIELPPVPPNIEARLGPQLKIREVPRRSTSETRLLNVEPETIRRVSLGAVEIMRRIGGDMDGFEEYAEAANAFAIRGRTH